MRASHLAAVGLTALLGVGWWLVARNEAADPAKPPASENKRLVYVVKHGTAADLAAVLGKHFKGVAEVESLPEASTNCLLINASPAAFGEVVKVLEQLDRPAHLVHVQVLIADTTPPDGIRAQGQGSGGFGGGGLRLDYGALFDRIAKGKAVLKRSDLTPLQQRLFDRVARAAGVTGGELTRDQWITGSEKLRQDPGGSRGGAQPPPRGRNLGGGAFDPASLAERRFKQLDRNGDGFLDDDEMSEDLKAEKEKWDTNHDGKIDLKEYKAFVAARVRQLRSEQQTDSGRGGFASRPGESGPPAIAGPAPTPAFGEQNDILDQKSLSGSIDEIRHRLEGLARQGRIGRLRHVELVAVENQQAYAFAHASKPFVTGSFVTTFGAERPIISYRSVGVNVFVTPRLTPEGKLSLKLDIGDDEIGPGSSEDAVVLGKDQQGTPIKANEFVTAHAATQLTLTPGQPVVLAGVQTTSKAGRAKIVMIVTARLADAPAERKNAPAPKDIRRRT